MTPAAGELVVAVSLQHMAEVSVDTDAATVTAGGGATIDGIATAAAAAGMFVPLGSRPSVGVGLALHGGVGHWSRTHGLACDSVLMVAMVTPDGEAVTVDDSSTPELMSAVRGAGSSFGCVTSLVLRAHKFSPLRVRTGRATARAGSTEQSLSYYLRWSAGLPRCTAMDVYICAAAGAGRGAAGHGHADTMTPIVLLQEFHQCERGLHEEESDKTPAGDLKQQNDWWEPVPGVPPSTIAKFTDVYEMELHRLLPKAARDFKRTALIPAVVAKDAAAVLRKAMEEAPTPLCYIHGVHIGGAAAASASSAAAVPTAFGNNRDWEWAFVVTGRANTPRSLADATCWVYGVVHTLLGLCPTHCAAYPADLGPGPQDALLARTCFGHNAATLAHLQQRLDPTGIFSLGVPLQMFAAAAGFRPAAATGVRVVVAVCGRRFAGKDHAASVLKQLLVAAGLRVVVVGISDTFKRQYAASAGVDVAELHDRFTKERHREAMNTAWKAQVEARGNLCDARCLADMVAAADEVNGGKTDVLIVTGMREGVHVARNVRAVHRPTWRVLVSASDAARASRGWVHDAHVDGSTGEAALDAEAHWDVVVANDDGNGVGDRATQAVRLRGDLADTVAWVRLHAHREEAEAAIAAGHPPPLLAWRVAAAARSIPDFPLPGVLFRDVLAVAHDPSLHRGVTDWIAAEVRKLCPDATAIVSVESSGTVFAAPAAMAANLPLFVVRKRSKGGLPREPQPRASTKHSGSNVTRIATVLELRLGAAALQPGARVVLVDDVLSTGTTARNVVDMLRDDLSVCVDAAVFVLKFAGHQQGPGPLLPIPVSALCTVAGR